MKTYPLEDLQKAIEAGVFYAGLRRNQKPGDIVLMLSERLPGLKDLKSDDLVNLAPHYVRPWLRSD